jgi:hypothetical protein
MWERKKPHLNWLILPHNPSCAAQVAVSQCFFNELFNPLDVAHREPLRLPAPIFSLDAGFQSCTQASIRLSPRTIQPNHFVAAFLACVGWLFSCTIYSDEFTRKWY